MPATTISGSRRLPVWGVLTLLIAVLAALVGPTGTAYAAASQPAPKVKTSATATPAKPKLVTKPVQPVKARIPVSPAATAKALRAAAVRSAIAHSSVADTCSGAIVADTVYPCSAPTGTDTYTLTLATANDLLMVRAAEAYGSTAMFTVTAPDGSPVTCQQPYWYSQCPTTQAGTYTVKVQDGGNAFTLAYTALLSDTSCTVADPSFSAPTLQGTLAAGALGNCYTLAMTSGSVLHVGLSSTLYENVGIAVYDATGATICADRQGDCTLTGTGPYRAMASDFNGSADVYYLQLNNITQPTGCLTATQQTYGAVPDTSSTVACRTLTVTAADQYQVYAASPMFGGVTGTLYNPDGTAACTNPGPTCQLVPGSYDFVANEYPQFVEQFGVVFIAADERRGCTVTGDTDFAGGPATGTFGGMGEELCLTLPTASGKSDYIFDQATADGSSPQMQVLDATGTQQCPDASFNYATCQLTGTAPFHAILSAQEVQGGYQLLVQRTDSSSGCAVWPQSGFGGSWGATVPLTVSSNIKCLSIPAGRHSVGEMIDYSNDANKVDGNITVNDPTGKQVCVGFSTTMCSYTAGVDYIALVHGVNLTGPDTYRVVRRDVSATAKCSTPASTTVGGPSTGFLLTSALDTACVRITAAATDKIWASARANVPGQAGAVLEVANADGTMICRQWGVNCQLTGSTSYQIIVIASGYAGISIPARVDTWRVGTAAGWAPECTAHQLSATGFPSLRGVLTETSTGYCAVVTMPPNQILGIGTVSPTDTGLPTVSMYTDWTNGLGLCNISGGNNFTSQCESQASTASQAVMLVTPGTSPTPVDYLMQGECAQICGTPHPGVTITSVTPSSSPTGTVSQAVVHGTGLTLGTKVSLVGDYGAVGNYQGVLSASADGTSLTALIDTSGLTPGSYGLQLNGVGYYSGTPSPGYLPNAYQVLATAAVPPNSLLVPLTPSRILDTRSGLGARKARVGARQTVKLTVANVAGVPTKGVTAVAMNVTAVAPSSAGYITVFPDGHALPTVSNLNFTAGQTIANLVVVPVVDGKVDLYNGSAGTVNLLADVTGYYTSSGKGSGLTTVGPSRILDTRSGVGAPKARVHGFGTVKLTVAKVAGVPVSGVTAVAMNVTAVAPSSAGYITVFPDGHALPTVSNLNFTAGRTIPNLVIVPVVDGKVDLYNGSAGTVDLLADITGYYSAGGSFFQTVGPMRAMDTRSGLGRAGGAVAPGGVASVDIMGLPGSPIPGTVTAVVLNVTVTGPADPGFLAVFPNGQPLPTVSNLNFAAGQTIANLVVVPVIDGRIDFYNGSPGTVQVFADLAGYYTT